MSSLITKLGSYLVRARQLLRYVSASSDEHSRLTLLPGVLVDTNGIALLRERGFDIGLQDKANKVFNWLSGYLAYPKEFDAIRMSIQS